MTPERIVQLWQLKMHLDMLPREREIVSGCQFGGYEHAESILRNLSELEFHQLKEIALSRIDAEIARMTKEIEEA